MKLLIIHNKYQSNNIGGEDIVYQNEIESLQKRLGKENVFSYEVSNDNLSKIQLIFNIWFNKYYYKEVKKIIEENNIDLVHVHNFYPLLTPSVFKAAKDAGAKVILTLHNYRLWCISGILYRDGYGVCEICTKHKFPIHGILHKCYRKSFVQSVLAQLSFWYYIAINVFENIDYFFVLTNFQKDKVKDFGLNEDKIIIKPNFIKMNTQVEKDRKGYIYVGRLEESKGIFEILELWQKLDQRYILVIIGTGDNEGKLKAKYKRPNIIFKGKCSREETLYAISKSKYLIQPSLLYETFGLTIIEAMSLGVPVIGYDIGTRRDFIKDGVNGFLYNRNNLESVIIKSYNYRDYDKQCQEAIKTARMYENNYIVEKQIEIYKKILENRI